MGEQQVLKLNQKIAASSLLHGFPNDPRVCCFVETTKNDLCNFLVRWGRSIGYEYAVSPEKSFQDVVTARSTPPTMVAVLGTNRKWTALVDNDRIGNWPLSTLVCAGEHLRTQWFAIATSNENSEIRSVGFIHGRHDLDRREIRVVKDGKWAFTCTGSVRSFEDEAAYAKRAICERLTNSMVIDYAARLGMDLAVGSEIYLTSESVFERRLL